MKVRDLIEQLRLEPQDADVHIAYVYPDHWRTTLAPTISRIEESPIVWSEYHRAMKVIPDDEDDDVERGDVKSAVCLFARGA
jgi:hypothetical protein